MCQVIGRPDLLKDDRFRTHWSRGQNASALGEIIGSWVAGHDVYTIADIFEDPQFRARDMLVEMEDPDLGTIVAPGVVPRLSETPGEARWTGSWRLGCHNREIYGGLLGLADDELAALTEAGVI